MLKQITAVNLKTVPKKRTAKNKKKITFSGIFLINVVESSIVGF